MLARIHNTARLRLGGHMLRVVRNSQPSVMGLILVRNIVASLSLVHSHIA